MTSFYLTITFLGCYKSDSTSFFVHAIADLTRSFKFELESVDILHKKGM